MANDIVTRVLHDGERNVVLHIAITGDGSGEETATELVDVSALGLSPAEVKLHAITGDLTGFSLTLEWDATANEVAWEVPVGHSFMDFEHTGGVINNAGDGKTGDIDFTTVGLGDGDVGTLLLELRKKF
jgi:hypothetical protein